MINEGNKLNQPRLPLCSLVVVLSMLSLFMYIYTEIDTFAQNPTVPLPSISKLPAVKITIPSNGENVTVHNPLPVSGISSDDGATNCQVSIIINNVKPYQEVNATGDAGRSDYSTWNYTLSSNYTQLNEGANKLTSRIICPDNMTNSSKWYSVNVTGYRTGISDSIKDNDNVTTINSNNITTNLVPNNKNILPQEHLVTESNLSSPSQTEAERLSSPSINQNSSLTKSIAPIANAGPDQTVSADSVVTLNGAQSRDLDGKVTSYSWVQVSGGPSIALQNADSTVAILQVPNVEVDTHLEFKLSVVDNDSLSSSDSINVLVKPKAQDEEISSKDVPCEEIGITNLC